MRAAVQRWMWPSGPVMVPTYLAYLTIFISRNSSQFVATPSGKDWQISLPYCAQQHFRCFRLSPRSSNVGRTKQRPQRHQHKRTEQAGGSQGRPGFFWDDRVLEPTKNGIECHCKQKTTRKTALPHAPGHEELSSGLSSKFNVSGTIAVIIRKKRQMNSDSWCAKRDDQLRQGVVFFSLRPREVSCFSFSISKSFLCETCNNLGESMEINTLEGALVEAFPDKFPKPHSIASVCPGVCFLKRVTQLNQSRAWLLGCSVSYVGAHGQSVSKLSRG